MRKKSILDNGIRVVTEQMREVRSAAIGVFLTAGSRDEPEELAGISHFIEHTVFKGTVSRSQFDIAKEADSIGGQLDAFTTREYTGFLARVLDEHLPKAFDILADILVNPSFPEGEIQRERGVILEEIKMIEDDPAELAHDLFFSLFFPDHPLGRSIIGGGKSVSRIGRDELLAYLARMVAPSRIIISAAGRVEHSQVVSLAEKYFSLLEGDTQMEVFPDPLPGSELRLVKRKRLEQVHLILGTESFPQRAKERYACALLNIILGGGVSSRLFQKIREEMGLAYSIHSFVSAYRDSGVFGFYAAVSPKNAGKTASLILKEVRNLTGKGMTREELLLARDHLKGRLMLSLEDSGGRMSKLAREEIYHRRSFSLDELLSRIEAVSEEELFTVARRLFSGKRLAMLALGDISGIEIDKEELIC
jgi:predicted Zn-dependent peptidase